MLQSFAIFCLFKLYKLIGFSDFIIPYGSLQVSRQDGLCSTPLLWQKSPSSNLALAYMVDFWQKGSWCLGLCNEISVTNFANCSKIWRKHSGLAIFIYSALHILCTSLWIVLQSLCFNASYSNSVTKSGTLWTDW